MVFEIEIELKDDQTAPTEKDIHDWILDGMEKTVGTPIEIGVAQS